MSEVDVIKEFLVSIGMKVDETQVKKSKEVLDKVTKTVEAVGVAITTMVALVKVGVEDMEESLEGLYFASQRIGDSVERIKAAGFAIGQMGGDAKAARASLENLAEAIRSNPSMEGLLNGMGVRTREANGDLRSRVEVFRDLAKQLQGMEYRVAKQRASLLGIDTNTLQAMRRGDIDKYMAQYDAMSKDVDMDKAAKGAHEFMNEMRALGASFEMILMLVASRWAPIIAVVANGLALLAKGLLWLDKHTGGFTTVLLSGAAALTAIAGAVGLVSGGLAGVGAAIAAVWAVILSPVTLVIAIVAALGFAAYELITHWDAVSGFFEGLWKRVGDAATEGAARVRKAIEDLKHSDFGKAAHDLLNPSHDDTPPAAKPAPAGTVAGPLLDHEPGRAPLDPKIPDVVRSTRDKTTKGLLNERAELKQKIADGGWGTADAKARSVKHYREKLAAVDAELAARATRIPAPAGQAAPTPAAQRAPGPWDHPATAPAAQASPAATVAGRIKQAFDYFRQQGWSQAQALGIVANLLGENRNLDPNKQETKRDGTPGAGYGIAQWTSGDRIREFAKWAGHSIYKSTFAEQLRFLQHEMETTQRRYADPLRRATSPQEAAAADVWMERPKHFSAEMRRRAEIADQLNRGTYPGLRGSGVSFAQQTTINVQGGEPTATGRAVAKEQGRVNGTLLRNLQGAVS